VFLDYDMPVKNGVEVAKEVKGRFSGMLVLCSGMKHEQEEESLFDFVLQKPIAKGELDQII